MSDDYLVDETEYSNNQEEEDPILVAQRYLNIFHQIHIFNQAKKDEFDKSLLDMPEKIKELLATIPGGRVLLEHVKEIEEKQGLNSGGTTELIAQNIEEEKKSIDNLAQHPLTGSGGELTLGADFAESLANSLAAALKNSNVAAAPSSNMADLAQILNKSFNAYAASMQTLTNRLVSQTNTTAMPQSIQTPAGVAAQQQNNSSTTVNNINLDTSYFNTLNQTLMQNDARRHDDMMQIVEAINKKLNLANINGGISAGIGAGAVSAIGSEMQAQAIAGFVTEALKQNNSQQMEAIKAFGEMLVQAITKSQQELAQTLAKSGPRHTVKVVVSQDVDVEDQTGGSTVAVAPAPVIAPIPTTKAEAAQPKETVLQKKDAAVQEQPELKEKTNFIKNFSDKISETTNKITQNLSKEAKNTSDSLLNNINKSLNKINDLKKQNQNKNNNQQPQKKADDKAIKNETPNNSKKENTLPKNQPIKENNSVKDLKNDNPKSDNSKQNTKNENKKPENLLQNEHLKDLPKPDKKQPENKPATQTVLPENIVKQPQTDKQVKTVQAIVPPAMPKDERQIVIPPQNNRKVKEKAEEVPQVEHPQKSADDALSIDDILAEIPTEEPDIFADDSFSKAADNNEPDIFSDNTFGEPETDKKNDNQKILQAATTPELPKIKPTSKLPDANAKQDTELNIDDLDLSALSAENQQEKRTIDDDLPKNEPMEQPAKEYRKSQLHSYEDALLKIKNALSSDNNVSINNLNVKPVSLGNEDDLPKPEPQQPKSQNAAPATSKAQDNGLWNFDDSLPAKASPAADNNGGDWEYVDENGNPVSADDSGDWEYVDENGNPVSADNGDDWEYVDENGNPISADDGGDWEYVDENGNPVSADEGGDWEYVDENGNPISADDGDDWEYVDENGNPVNKNKA